MVVVIAGVVVSLATGVGGNALDRIRTGKPESGDWVTVAVVAIVLMVAGALVWSRARRADSGSAANSLVDLTATRRYARSVYNSMGDRTPVSLFTVPLQLAPDLVRPLDASLPLSAPPADDIIDVFVAAGQRLLIVGEAGSGKTMMLHRLLQHVEQSDSDHVPLLVSLSSWRRPGEQTFRDYLVRVLSDRSGPHMLSKRDAEVAVDTDSFALLLDGLDEAVDFEQLSAAISGKDGFLRSSRMPVVVTCRESDYEKIGLDLGLGAAVRVLDLTPVAVRTIARESVERLALESWRPYADGEAKVEGWMLRPLLLTTAITLGADPGTIVQASGDAASTLFEQLLTQQLADHCAGATGYGVEDARRWLAFVAAYLSGSLDPMEGLTPTTDSRTFSVARMTNRGRTFKEQLTVGCVVAVLWGAVSLALGLQDELRRCPEVC